MPTPIGGAQTATALCIVSPIPLMLLAAAGVWCLISAGVRWASLQKLLRQGDFDPSQQKERRIKETVATAYWLIATAVYLLWSFLTEEWRSTWVVWPVAGVLFPVAMGICGLAVKKGDKE